MTLSPCLEHVPMHSFQRGWICGRCGAPVSPSAPLDENSLRAKIRALGDELHNVATEHQNDEALAERLGSIRSRLWSLAAMASAVSMEGDAKSVASEAAISAMVSTYNRVTGYAFPQASVKEQRDAMFAVYAVLNKLEVGEE